jgi:hypothetical protein
MQEEINAIIRAAPELVKHGTELVAALKLTEIAKAILGPATNEVAERIRDEVRLYRFGRQLSCIKKAEKMAQDAGFTPKAVPIKLLFPLLEGASLEEDESLQDMWSALLANASSENAVNLVRPSFPEILKIMTPDVAKLLNFTFDVAWEKAHPTPRPSRNYPGDSLEPDKPPSLIQELNTITLINLGTYRKLYERFEDANKNMLGQADDERRQNFAILMDELHRFQMWSMTQRESGDHYYLSALAAQFVTVCRSPKPKS